MRRVNCPTCGIKVETVPWAQGKRTVTTAYAWFLARWAKRLSWAQVAEAFRTSWHMVYCSVDQAVQWGRAHQDLEGITAIGVDELCWGRWHRYVTVVYQINRDTVRLLCVGEHRRAKTLLRFFRWFGKERTGQLQYICSNMWRPYLKVIAKKASHAIYLLKEDFQFFWSYRSAYWAGLFLDRWCTRAMRSRIEPMKHVAKMLRRHRELILNWFRAKKAFSSGIVEGLNAKAKLTTRKAYGYKTFKTLELALYHNLGALPEPEIAHRFF